MNDNIWNSGFGRILVISSLVALVVGFGVAAGGMALFKDTAPESETFQPQALVEPVPPVQESLTDALESLDNAALEDARPADDFGTIEEGQVQDVEAPFRQEEAAPPETYESEGMNDVSLEEGDGQ